MFISSHSTWILIYPILIRCLGQAYMVSVLPVHLLAPRHIFLQWSVERAIQIKPLKNWPLTMQEWNQFSVVSCLFQHTAPCTLKQQQLNGATLGISTPSPTPKMNLQDQESFPPHGEQTRDKHKASFRFRKEKLFSHVTIYLHLP